MLLRLQKSYAAMNTMVREQERTANNLANANTIGFKRDRTFTEALDEHLDHERSPQSTARVGQWADFAQGAVEATGSPLDVAIQGDGLFAVTDPAGDTRYTRAGRFSPDAEGVLRDIHGFAVEGRSGGPIQLPRTAEPITISATGEVRAGEQVVDRIRVVRFENPAELRRLDGSTFAAPDGAAADVERPDLMAGHVETSNVNPLDEMTSMISHLRLFESQQRWLQTSDGLLGRITGELGRF